MRHSTRHDCVDIIDEYDDDRLFLTVSRLDCPGRQSLLASHRLRSDGADFLSFLDERTAVATPERQQVHDETTRNVLLSSHLATYLSSTDEVGDGNELNQSADETALADLLGDPAGRVARHDVRDDADTAVVEAAEQAMLEFVRHLSALYNNRTLYNSRGADQNSQLAVSNDDRIY